MDDTFEAHRAELFGAAYRMLGTRADAEDVLQEAWLRWGRVDRATVRNPRAYLFRLVTNEAIDQLRRVRARREEYVGPWLPEPLVEAAEPGEAVSVGLLVVLETLSADERAVFVLHEAFAFSHAEIAEMLGRTERAVRQLAYRARRHVQARRPHRRPSRAEHRELTARFVAAAVDGDVAALVRLLAPGVELRADSDGRRETPRRPVLGAAEVAAWFRTAAPFWPAPLAVRVTPVNGAPGALVLGGDTPFLVFALEYDEDDRVAAVYAVLNPEKLPGH